MIVILTSDQHAGKPAQPRPIIQPISIGTAIEIHTIFTSLDPTDVASAVLGAGGQRVTFGSPGRAWANRIGAAAECSRG